MGGIIDTLTVRLCLDTSELDAAVERVRASLKRLDEDLKSASRVFQPPQAMGSTITAQGSVREETV